MPNIGPLEIFGLLLIFVLLFGARKLPDLGSSIGKSIRNFKKGVDEGKDEDVVVDPVTGKTVESSTGASRVE
jgi:sec-independent protein translocase protein TatA